MKCFYHCGEDAVAVCVDCGKGLCYECAHRFSVPICPECNLQRIKVSRKLLIKNAIIMIVAFIIGFSYGLGPYSNTDMGMRIFMGYLFAGIPWGWSALTRITPNVFLSLPWVGWLIYVGIKLCLSFLIGMFVTPYKIYKTVKGLIQAEKNEKYTKQF